jgi:zinc transporter 1/2/3
MLAVYFIFFSEVAAYRIGSAKMAKIGITYNTHNDAEAEHGHAHSHVVEEPAGTSTGPIALASPSSPSKEKDLEASSSSEGSWQGDDVRVDYDVGTTEGVAQLIAVAVLEFGVILHSIIIGLTLAVSDEFITLFVVIIFHRESRGNPRS